MQKAALLPYDKYQRLLGSPRGQRFNVNNVDTRDILQRRERGPPKIPGRNTNVRPSETKPKKRLKGTGMTLKKLTE